ncbi:hypothetical protein GCM10010371_63770 [Streptomyces subrutilus]|uniref:Uncharacterized protein n=1 Tax=Streptomyces subrutilus TaxID=36818 RepID=A0A918VGH2_9ACTN|nr:hypothetical protein [Streptomyces subrutilus]GGZ95116.1 hypothetical protein GCM10010371_63770 [Streptomyces subrutilus]
MLTDQPVGADRATAPFLVSKVQDLRGLRPLIEAHQAVCPDGVACRDCAGLDERLRLPQTGPFGVWVMTDTDNDRPLAAAHLGFGLAADGLPLMHVWTLLTDPHHPHEHPREVMSAWSTHWAASGPWAVREVRLHTQCPLAVTTPTGTAVHWSERTPVEGRTRRTDMRTAVHLPALEALVSTRHNHPDSPYEVTPLRGADRDALGRCLAAVGVTGRAAHYPQDDPDGGTRSRLVLGPEGLAAVFTETTTNPHTTPAPPRLSACEPALHLDRLRPLQRGYHTALLVWLTGWATWRAQQEGLRLVTAQVTDRAVARHLNTLGWFTTGIKPTPGGGFRWHLELTAPQPPQNTPAAQEEARR